MTTRVAPLPSTPGQTRATAATTSLPRAAQFASGRAPIRRSHARNCTHSEAETDSGIHTDAACAPVGDNALGGHGEARIGRDIVTNAAGNTDIRIVEGTHGRVDRHSRRQREHRL